MLEFKKMKEDYSATIQLALTAGATRAEVKNGNEILHNFCDLIVEGGNYCDRDKAQMKHELKLLKIYHDRQIDQYFGWTGM